MERSSFFFLFLLIYFLRKFFLGVWRRSRSSDFYTKVQEDAGKLAGVGRREIGEMERSMLGEIKTYVNKQKYMFVLSKCKK